MVVISRCYRTMHVISESLPTTTTTTIRVQFLAPHQKVYTEAKQRAMGAEHTKSKSIRHHQSCRVRNNSIPCRIKNSNSLPLPKL